MKLYKNTIILIVTVILIVGFVFSSSYIFERIVARDIKEINNMVENILASETADKSELESLKSKWHFASNYWSLFLNHASINEVDMSIYEFINWVELEEREHSKVESEKLSRLFQTILEHDKLTITNIL